MDKPVKEMTIEEFAELKQDCHKKVDLKSLKKSIEEKKEANQSNATINK